jgi:predicted Zn-dependent protease
VIRRFGQFILATLVALSASLVEAHPDPKHSLAAIDEHLVASPKDPQLYLTKADILLGIGHVDEAVKCVDQAAAINPSAAGLGFMEARLFLAAGDPKGARQRLEGFLKDEPAHADALRLSARLSADAGYVTAAIAAAEKLVQAEAQPSPNDVTRCASLYLHRHHPGDDDLALRALDTGLRRIGCLKGLHFMACDIELRLARYDAALARLAVLSARYHPSVEFEVRRAEILVAAGRKSEAAQAYDNAVAIMDSYPRERQTGSVFAETKTKFISQRDALRSEGTAK